MKTGSSVVQEVAMAAAEAKAAEAPAKVEAEKAREELLAQVLENHPNLTRAEALEMLEAFGG
jgi:hypothetical protein